MSSSLKNAEMIGVQAAAWLVSNDELFQIFMGSTGASVSDFRAGLEDPAFQASILDFLLMDDKWVIDFCDAHDLAYDRVMQARAALPGGDQVHWT